MQSFGYYCTFTVSDYEPGFIEFIFTVGTEVRVLFHNLISPISIYTSRAIWARLAMFHVIEFNLWPKSSA